MKNKQADTHKKITDRGAYVIPPVAGDEFSELRVGHHKATLIFQDSHGASSQLELWEAITLVQGDVEIYMNGCKPGCTSHPNAFTPLLDMLGAMVVDARASRNGMLEIDLSNGWKMRIVPDSGYEAWEFKGWGYSSIIGADAHLIIFR